MMGSLTAYSPGRRAVLLRAHAVAAAAVAGGTGLLALLRGAARDVLRQAGSTASWSELPFDAMIMALAAVALAGCGVWLLAVTLGTAVEALTGASSAVLRAVSPGLVRRVVLMCCGIAVGGAGLLPPAVAADRAPIGEGPPTAGSTRAGDGATSPLAGLRLPDRPVGKAPAARVESSAGQQPTSSGWNRPPSRDGGPGRATAEAGAEAGADLVTVAAVRRRETTYVVRPGDSLWAIAARLRPAPTAAEVDAAWRHLHLANRDVIGPDPDLITPGTRLRISPQVAGTRDHDRPGDPDGARRHRKDAS